MAATRPGDRCVEVGRFEVRQIRPGHAGQEGESCYLGAADPDSRMSRLADEAEEDLIASVEQLLADAGPEPIPADADRDALCGMVGCLIEALRTTLRIAVSRGARLP
ncbi:hypothetical protein ACIBJC_24115 [Streptomyces sp. NPDC050509]|uniref:hypothetical protein n=1 Tax=Streptomyces sp. NPDC050509 TaxID=3365620 RepID=UPI0037B29D9D